MTEGSEQGQFSSELVTTSQIFGAKISLATQIGYGAKTNFVRVDLGFPVGADLEWLHWNDGLALAYDIAPKQGLGEQKNACREKVSLEGVRRLGREASGFSTDAPKKREGTSQCCAYSTGDKA